LVANVALGAVCGVADVQTLIVTFDHVPPGVAVAPPLERQ
jgi:hypothetical protein